MDKELRRLSKFISRVLRHEPERLAARPVDEEGEEEDVGLLDHVGAPAALVRVPPQVGAACGSSFFRMDIFGTSVGTMVYKLVGD